MLEVPFASVWPMFRAGAVRFRVGGGGWLPGHQERAEGGPWFGRDIKKLHGLSRDRGSLLS